MQHFHGGQAGTNEDREEEYEDRRTERLEDENAGGPSELPVVRGLDLLSIQEEHDCGGDVVHPDGLHEEAEPAPQTRDEQPATAGRPEGDHGPEEHGDQGGTGSGQDDAEE